MYSRDPLLLKYAHQYKHMIEFCTNRTAKTKLLYFNTKDGFGFHNLANHLSIQDRPPFIDYSEAQEGFRLYQAIKESNIFVAYNPTDDTNNILFLNKKGVVEFIKEEKYTDSFGELKRSKELEGEHEIVMPILFDAQNIIVPAVRV